MSVGAILFFLIAGSCDISFDIYSTELGGNLVVPALGSAVDCLDVTRLGDCALSKENADFQKYFRFINPYSTEHKGLANTKTN